MSRSGIEVLPASTVMLLRVAGSAFEVLMVERAQRGFFGGLMVFPGGGVDEADISEVAREVVSGDADDQPYRAAALRELAEETGIAITTGGICSAPNARGPELYRVLQADGASLDGECLVLVSRWITPRGAPKRYDTRFYVVEVEGDPAIRLDTSELVYHSWVSPELALGLHEEGEWKMFTPTVAHLRWMARQSSVAEVISSAVGADGRTVIEPQLMEDGSMMPIATPASD